MQLHLQHTIDKAEIAIARATSATAAETSAMAAAAATDLGDSRVAWRIIAIAQRRLLLLQSCLEPGKVLEYDAAKCVFKNSAVASAALKRTYRKGWEVTNL